MKRALVVGINDYAPVGPGGPDLRGCVNDAADMANTLVACGFPPIGIKVLTNQNATKANILNIFTSLLRVSNPGDSAVLFYSGHGTKMANIGPDFEPDGIDEAICPHNVSAAGPIRDDDFAKIIALYLKPTVNLDVIFDSCYSGTATRAINETGDLYEYDGIRCIPPMLDDSFYYPFEQQVDENEKGLTGKKAMIIVPGMKHVLWAACRSNQVSLEGPIGGKIRGYFTYCLCKALRATAGNITRARLDYLIKSCMAPYSQQINQTEGPQTEMVQRIFA